MDGFSGYNQIQIHSADQYKTAFTTPWGNFAYRVMPFGLKNAGATFQWAMTYIFHDLAHIILTYLDDHHSLFPSLNGSWNDSSSLGFKPRATYNLA